MYRRYFLKSRLEISSQDLDLASQRRPVTLGDGQALAIGINFSTEVLDLAPAFRDRRGEIPDLLFSRDQTVVQPNDVMLLRVRGGDQFVHASVLDEQPKSDGVLVVKRQGARVLDEPRVSGQRVVLNVPAPLSLLRQEPRAALPRHLSFAVGLSPDRVMPKQKPDRKHTPAGESGFVPAGGDEINGCLRLLPALDLQAIEGLRLRIVTNGLTDARLVAAIVLRGLEIQHVEVDRVVAERVHSTNGVAKGQARPRALPEFVGVMMDEPVGRNLATEGFLAAKKRLPGKRSAGVESLETDDPPTPIGLDLCEGVIVRRIVDEVDLDSVGHERTNNLADDVGFVVGSNDGNDVEVLGQPS